MTHIFVATASHDGKVCAEYLHSMFATDRDLRERGIPWTVSFVSGDPYIDHARNVLLEQFWRSTATHCLFIDSDVGWKAEDVQRLLRMDVPVCAGVYRYKVAEVQFPMIPKMADGKIVKHGQYIEADGVPAGFLMIRRDALERMREAYPQLHCGKFFAAFTPAVFNGEWQPEDYLFCLRWRDVGGKILVDPHCDLSHTDGKTAFRGTLAQNMP